MDKLSISLCHSASHNNTIVTQPCAPTISTCNKYTSNIPCTVMAEMMATGCHLVPKTTVAELAIGLLKYCCSSHMQCYQQTPTVMETCHHQTLAFLVPSDLTLNSAVVPMDSAKNSAEVVLDSAINSVVVPFDSAIVVPLDLAINPAEVVLDSAINSLVVPFDLAINSVVVLLDSAINSAVEIQTLSTDELQIDLAWQMSLRNGS